MLHKVVAFNLGEFAEEIRRELAALGPGESKASFHSKVARMRNKFTK